MLQVFDYLLVELMLINTFIPGNTLVLSVFEGLNVINYDLAAVRKVWITKRPRVPPAPSRSALWVNILRCLQRAVIWAAQ